MKRLAALLLVAVALTAGAYAQDGELSGVGGVGQTIRFGPDGTIEWYEADGDPLVAINPYGGNGVSFDYPGDAAGSGAFAADWEGILTSSHYLRTSGSYVEARNRWAPTTYSGFYGQGFTVQTVVNDGEYGVVSYNNAIDSMILTNPNHQKIQTDANFRFTRAAIWKDASSFQATITASLAAGEVAEYRKGTNLVRAYNDAGTIKYQVMALGTDATFGAWSTTAP
jgi:hypothetical protein